MSSISDVGRCDVAIGYIVHEARHMRPGQQTLQILKRNIGVKNAKEAEAEPFVYYFVLFR